MRFIVPICYIGYLMYITKVVDKWFVLNVVTQSTILVLNIGFAFFYRLQRNFWKSEELQLQMATSYLKDNEIKNLEKQLKDLHEERMANLEEFARSNVKNIMEHIGGIVKIIDKITERFKEIDKREQSEQNQDGTKQ